MTYAALLACLRDLAERGDPPTRLLARDLLVRWSAREPERIERNGRTVLVGVGLQEVRLVLPEEVGEEADAWGAAFLAALDLGPYERLPTDLVPGEPVILTLFETGEEIPGRFVACLDDDDPDEGRGETYRILGDDLQVWEGATCRPRSEP